MKNSKQGWKSAMPEKVLFNYGKVWKQAKELVICRETKIPLVSWLRG